MEVENTVLRVIDGKEYRVKVLPPGVALGAETVEGQRIYNTGRITLITPQHARPGCFTTPAHRRYTS